MKSLFFSAKSVGIFLLFTLLFNQLVVAQSLDEKVASTLKFVESQLRGTIAEVNTNSDYLFPRWVDHSDGLWRNSVYHKWTAGFFPGCLWYMYKHTGKNEWLQYARNWTKWLEEAQYITSLYTDLGFTMVPTYVRGFELINDSTYLPVIENSGYSYGGRWHNDIKVFECWDHDPWLSDTSIVSGAIDQLMNMDIFFEAYAINGDTTLRNIGIGYAETVMKNSVRDDFSTYQEVRYDNTTGEVVGAGNIQGYGEEGAWSRGQGWATYGFTMIYRYTQDQRFLDTAIGLANFYIDNAPEDGVAYWDFRAPNIPDEPRDASSATIVCSALFELLNYVVGETKVKFEEAAFRMLDTLMTDNYLADGTTTNALILQCTGNGNKPESGQINSSHIYADYYFIEALLRYQEYREATFIEQNQNSYLVADNHILIKNYPNPFNPSTIIEFSIPRNSDVNIKIFNVLGKSITTLTNGSLQAGSYKLHFNAGNLPAGTYFCRVEAGNQVATHKLLLIK